MMDDETTQPAEEQMPGGGEEATPAPEAPTTPETPTEGGEDQGGPTPQQPGAM